MDRIYRMDEMLAAAEAVRSENEALRAECERLRGRLMEAHREARRLRRAALRGQRDGAYWRQLIAASVGMAVALTCLLHSMVFAGGGWL